MKVVVEEGLPTEELPNILQEGIKHFWLQSPVEFDVSDRPILKCFDTEKVYQHFEIYDVIDEVSPISYRTLKVIEGGLKNYVDASNAKTVLETLVDFDYTCSNPSYVDHLLRLMFSKMNVHVNIEDPILDIDECLLDKMNQTDCLEIVKLLESLRYLNIDGMYELGGNYVSFVILSYMNQMRSDGDIHIVKGFLKWCSDEPLRDLLEEYADSIQLTYLNNFVMRLLK